MSKLVHKRAEDWILPSSQCEFAHVQNDRNELLFVLSSYTWAFSFIIFLCYPWYMLFASSRHHCLIYWMWYYLTVCFNLTSTHLWVECLLFEKVIEGEERLSRGFRMASLKVALQHCPQRLSDCTSAPSWASKKLYSDIKTSIKTQGTHKSLPPRLQSYTNTRAQGTHTCNLGWEALHGITLQIIHLKFSVTICT